MSASIEVRISSHYVSLKKAVVTTRIRADRRILPVRTGEFSVRGRSRTNAHLIGARPDIVVLEPESRPFLHMAAAWPRMAWSVETSLA